MSLLSLRHSFLSSYSLSFVSPLWKEIQTARRHVLQEVYNASSQVAPCDLAYKNTNIFYIIFYNPANFNCAELMHFYTNHTVYAYNAFQFS